MRWLIDRLPQMKANYEHAMARATSVTQVITDMPRSHSSGDRMGDNVDRIIIAKRVLRESQERLALLQNTVTEHIEALEDPKLKKAMQLRYIDCYGITDVAFAMGYSRQWARAMLATAEGIIAEALKSN